MPKITCPNCGQRGRTEAWSEEFELRGQWQGKPVRKCHNCGAGMTVVPSLTGAKAKLIDEALWDEMEKSWERPFPDETAETDDFETNLSPQYPVASCPYCGNTGSTEPGSPAFEYRVSNLGGQEPKARMCRRCEQGFWLYSDSGVTEPMSDEAWDTLEFMHEGLGGGAEVDRHWANRKGAREPSASAETEAEASCEASPHAAHQESKETIRREGETYTEAVERRIAEGRAAIRSFKELDEDFFEESTARLESSGAPEGSDEDDGREIAGAAPVTGMPVALGEAVTLRGKAPEIEASVLYLQDPAAGEEGIEPDEGMRYVGVFLQIRNTGDDEYDQTPSMEARLVTSNGDEHEPSPVGWVKPDLDDLTPIEPGKSGAGFLTFELPEGAVPQTFRFIFAPWDAKSPPEAGVWNLEKTGDREPVEPQKSVEPGRPRAITREVPSAVKRSSRTAAIQGKVLVIDDEAPLRLLWRAMLEEQGMEVLEASDGPSGLEEARREKPDVILLDVMMPALDGWRVAEQLREMRETRDIPFVFVTPRSEYRDQLRGLELGAVDYIPLPFNPLELPGRVQEVLERRARGELEEMRRERIEELTARMERDPEA
jgi:CheY-like chemotaxis protein